MRYRLRTLLILLAVMPPLLAVVWWAWPKVAETNKQSAIADFDKLIELITQTIRPDSWDDLGGPGSIDQFSTIRCFELTETETEDDPVGPDPCGRSYSFRPYSAVEDDVLLPITIVPITLPLADDPFAVPK
jgi:hypothetical protein